jgi:hypothetical protein
LHAMAGQEEGSNLSNNALKRPVMFDVSHIPNVGNASGSVGRHSQDSSGHMGYHDLETSILDMQIVHNLPSCLLDLPCHIVVLMKHV